MKFGIRDLDIMSLSIYKFFKNWGRKGHIFMDRNEIMVMYLQ